MAIHTTRDNFLYGVGDPNIASKFHGQIYIDTHANSPAIWIATKEGFGGWKKVSLDNHTHELTDILELDKKIDQYINSPKEEGDISLYESFATRLRCENHNVWEGANYFSQRPGTSDGSLLSQGSSLGDLGDVELIKRVQDPNTGEWIIESSLEEGTLLGYNGTSFVPFKLEGSMKAVPVTPKEELYQTDYIRRTELVTTFDSLETNKPLAANVGNLLLNEMKQNYSPIGHSHADDYSPSNHTHDNYLEKENVNGQLMKGPLTISAGKLSPALSLNGELGRIDFNMEEKFSPEGLTEGVTTGISFGVNGANEDLSTSVLLGGPSGSTGEEMILNFEKITIPSGGIDIGETKKQIGMPPILIDKPDLRFIGENTRQTAIDVNGGAINGLSQLVFKNPSLRMDNSIMFPKSYAGYGQQIDSNYYHYLRLADGQMITDTALNSEQNYIQLNGKRIFFTSQDPGKLAREGDIWCVI